MTNIADLTVEQLKQTIAIREQIDSLRAELNRILGGEVSAPVSKASPASPVKRRKGKMSAAGRAAIAAAQRARWAKSRGEKVETTAAKPKRVMSAAAKAAISAAAKKRWRKAKAAGKTRL